ncbi:hypothetical protein M885DRAFT_225835 [Pelagophyceae sp. CCMP2097]|nr:hypothetical protein M885DRAFT_225835 [Pelagophyceae sp. CCMP2097]
MDEASRVVQSRPAAPAAAPVLKVLELSDLLALILRLGGKPDALLVTARVARNARAVAPTVRKLIWIDRILKGTAIIKGHTNYVRSCAFSPDGKRIVTASYDRTARLWDAETDGCAADDARGARRLHLQLRLLVRWQAASSRPATASYDGDRAPQGPRAFYHRSTACLPSGLRGVSERSEERSLQPFFCGRFRQWDLFHSLWRERMACVF